MPTTARTLSRIAHLADSDQDDYPHTVHGVAHGEDELTKGLNGPKYWPAAELQAAAPTLEGKPVVTAHDGDRRQVGEVLRAAYQSGLGVVYEAGLEDAEIAEQLSSGQREVSIEAGNPDAVDQHEATGAAIMRGYEYTALATPEQGASPGNYTAPGAADGNPAVAALSAGDIETVLDGEAALDEYRSVAGVRFRGTRDGKLDTSALPNTDGDYEQHYLFDAETASASSYPVVDADGYLRRGNVAAAYSLGPRGGVSQAELYEKLRPLNDAFSTPPIEPEKLQPEAAAAAAGDLRVDAAVLAAAQAEMPATDDPGGARSPARDADDATPGGGDSMTDDDNNDHDVEALLQRLDEKDEKNDALESELEEVQADLEAKEEQLEELEDEVQAAKGAYAARLAAHDPVNDEDDYCERFELAELRQKTEDLDEDLGDDPQPDVQSGGGSGGGSDDMDDADRERIEEIEAKLSTIRSALPQERVEALEEEAAELAGTDDYEAALEAI